MTTSDTKQQGGAPVTRRANILTIAGSDSGGGAGIQADLKTIAALGGFGMSVITALTAQNGLGVRGIHAPEPGFVALQLETVRQGFDLDAAKTGMLFSAPIIEAVAAQLADKDFPLVVDPVSVSQSGHRLLEPEALEALKSRMLPLADLLTPNIPEAEALTGMDIQGPQQVPEAARRLLDMGARAVLIKGGHMESGAQEAAVVTDWLCLPGQTPEPMSAPRIETPNTHGTGCTLSAAIATLLGQGRDLREAVLRGREYLRTCLHAGYAPGKGFGPPDHMAGCGLEKG